MKEKNKLSGAECLIFALPLLAYSTPAFAYLDPGTGSMLLSALVGLSSTLYFSLKKFPSLLTALFSKFGRKSSCLPKKIVFYSESKNYWNTFEPILTALNRKKVEVSYLTSDKDDPIFGRDDLTFVDKQYIGRGNSAYSKLNFLECNLFVLTTPGVDVLQIKRSRGVKKYVHIVHSLSDIHGYKLYSFDYYDTVICSGKTQIQSIRDLEEKRKTRSKELVLLGCPYLDNLVKRNKESSTGKRGTDFLLRKVKTIILAPTWGKNSYLYRCDPSLLVNLTEEGYDVIFRPHPQSFISDKERLNEWLSVLRNTKSASLDDNPDGSESFAKSMLMISDLSGVVFDYALIYKKPVITLSSDFHKDGFEAWDLSKPAWELNLYDRIGAHISSTTFESIYAAIKKVEKIGLLDDILENEFIKNEVINFGCASVPIADYLLEQLNILQAK